MKKISDEKLKNIVDEVVSSVMTDMPSLQQNVAALDNENKVESQFSEGSFRSVALGADHGGFDLKEELKTFLKKKAYKVEDCGTHSTESVDYPDFAKIVASKVRSGEVWRGIIVDGAGIGSCMAANKVPGVRAAMCYDYATAYNSREHNNANVLTLGAGLIGSNLAKQIVNTFLETDFAGGRHKRRIEKIMEIENEY